MNSDITWLKQTAGRVPLLTAAEEITLGSAIRAWLDHPDGPDAAPAAIQRRGRRARDRMISGNLRLVISYVLKLQKETFLKHNAEDLVSAGNSGLTRAAEKFDPERGYKFSTYAYWWIRQAVTKYKDQNDSIVSQAPSRAEHRRIIGQAMQQLTAELQRHPTEAELRAAIIASGRLSNAQISEAVASGRPVISLDAPLSDETTLADLLAAPDTSDPDAEELALRLAHLPPDLRRLVVGSWGLDGQRPWTIADAAREMGMAKSRVSAERRRAMMLLRLPPKSRPRRQQSAPNRPPPEEPPQPGACSDTGQHSLPLQIEPHRSGETIGGSDMTAELNDLCGSGLVASQQGLHLMLQNHRRSQPVRRQRRQLSNGEALGFPDSHLQLQFILNTPSAHDSLSELDQR